jgi:hypothetical protein
MSDPQIKAAFYLSPSIDSHWRWSDDGETLTWPDDATIAFGPEVRAVLERLSGGGLPPFGGVALLLAACRDGWPTSRGRAEIAGHRYWAQRMDSNVFDTHAHPAVGLVSVKIANELEQLLEGLDAINRLPPHLREGVGAKSVLAEMVFEGSRKRTSPEDAATILGAMEEGLSPTLLRPQLHGEAPFMLFVQQIEGLSAGLGHVDAEALALRARTGLDDLPDPADQDLSPPERVWNLIASLKEDAELGPLAKLACDLMAAVSVPRSLRIRDELAVGGVSDLTNRGPLDRLLVSELAYDDLTLAVRVAVNEALYLRREAPAREPPHRRAILIDAGIRMWGVPRIFAAAAAMAMAATNQPDAALAVYRAAANAVCEVDLTRRGGLENHLAALALEPHPGAALAAFFEALEGREGHTDAIVITHADALADPSFRAAAAALGVAGFYVASVDATGRFVLCLLGRAGIKPIREAKLSLEGLLNPAKSKRERVPLVDPAKSTSLPAIFYQSAFPLRVPHVVDPKLTVVSSQGVMVAATRDGRLLHWTTNSLGARQLTGDLPRGRIAKLAVIDNEAVALITRKKERAADLFRIDLMTLHRTQSVVELPVPDPQGVFAHGGLLYIVSPSRIDAVEPASGKVVASLSSPFSWHRERFFLVAGGYSAVAYDGSSTLVFHRLFALARLHTLFDREGFEGPLSLLRDGSILGPDKQVLHRIGGGPSNIKVLGISTDGHRLALQWGSGKYLVDLSKARSGEMAAPTSRWEADLLGPRVKALPHAIAHTKFRAVFRDAKFNLSLVTRTGRVFTFLDDRGELVLAETGVDVKGPSHAISFNPIRRERGMGCHLAVATWRDGSKAWLDSRGLLHLRSSDTKIPEFSLTLSNLRPAAWSAEGVMAGSAYFTGEGHREAHKGYFADLLRRFVGRTA